jgi:hypothetical protein
LIDCLDEILCFAEHIAGRGNLAEPKGQRILISSPGIQTATGKPEDEGMEQDQQDQPEFYCYLTVFTFSYRTIS